jgi:hypothetical protein
MASHCCIECQPPLLKSIIDARGISTVYVAVVIFAVRKTKKISLKLVVELTRKI